MANITYASDDVYYPFRGLTVALPYFQVGRGEMDYRPLQFYDMVIAVVTQSQLSVAI